MSDSEDGRNGTSPSKPGSDDSAVAASMRPGQYDPLAEEEPAIPATGNRGNHAAGETPNAAKKPRPKIEFYTPSQLRAYAPPPDQNMLGDFHMQRGALAVLAGPPGCGKSRAALWLGLLGAAGSGNWFGKEIHCPFRTLIIQNENGLTRLHRDFEQIPPIDGLDDWLRISAPPVCGLNLERFDVRTDLKEVMRDFAPNLVVIDPWNACVNDGFEKDFQAGLSRVREIMAEAPGDPATLILHHLRKPKSEDRQRGRALANLLSGSYVLISASRSVFVMQPGSDDTEGDEVVLTTAKNNDGHLGPRTAWRREAWQFVSVPDFDFEAFDGGGDRRSAKIQEEHIIAIFENGRRQMALKRAVEALEELTGAKDSAAYEALRTMGGRFSHLLQKNPDGLIGLKSSEDGPAAGEPVRTINSEIKEGN